MDDIVFLFAHLGGIFYLRVRKRDTILIWGYAEGYNLDWTVCDYHKLRTPALH